MNMAQLYTEEVSLTDQELVDRISNGETDLFEAVMRRYNQRLFRTVRSIVGDELEAEDVLQDTYVRAFEHLGQFAGAAKFSTWLTKIAINEALSRLRGRRRFQALDESDEIGVSARGPSRAPGPEEEVVQEQTARLLEAAVDGLPEPYRCVFVMRAVNGMTTSETAECLNLTEENVKIRMHRARAMLRRQLSKRFGSAISGAFPFLGYRCDRVVHAVMYRVRKLAAK
jgi:RNA polymerase sigma-70 factor, ECF subfamily